MPRVTGKFSLGVHNEQQTDSKLGKEYFKTILLPCLFNLYGEYIIWNAGLDEAQAGIKISRRNIKNLRYTDDTTIMAESEEELKSLLMKVKEESEKAKAPLNESERGEWKRWLKTQHSKN